MSSKVILVTLISWSLVNKKSDSGTVHGAKNSVPHFEIEEESYNVFFRSLQVAASGSHHPSLPILSQLTH